MKASFKKDYLSILNQQEEARELRAQTLYVPDLVDKLPLNELERLIYLWPTHDIRYLGYGTADDDLIVDMIKGANIKTLRKDISKGVLELTVEFIKNLAEIERYNRAVQKHNREWLAKGAPTEVFDPVHGDISKVEDQFVDPVYISSNSYKIPDSAHEDVSTGPLARTKPTTERACLIRLKYQVEIKNSYFILSYAAYNTKDEVLYYSKAQHKDLSYLVRKSVQEIWGNPVAFNETDNLLEGVSMLIHGKKLEICKRDNDLPSFLMEDTTKVKVPRNLDKDIGLYKVLSLVCSRVLPLTFIFGFIICFCSAFISFNIEDNAYPLMLKSSIASAGFSIQGVSLILIEILMKSQVFLSLIMLLGIIVARKLSLYLDRKISEISALNKFV